MKGSKRRTNVQRKISISAFLLYALKFFYRASDPVKWRGHEHHSGAAKRVYQSRYPPHPTPPYAWNQGREMRA